MKIKAAAITILFVLLSATTAYAKNGVHIGPGYGQFPDECAACHRAHTGGMERLLFTEATTTYGFCTTCHNGTGANTNVVRGMFEGDFTTWGTQGHGTAQAGLNGGGFESAVAYTGKANRMSAPVAIASDTNRHNATGSDDAINTAWGGGSSGPGTQMTLTCTSCHDPHGTDNANGSERYRILRDVVNGNNVDAIIISNENGTHDYTTTKYRNGLATFCEACHTQYSKMSGYYDAGDGNGLTERYRHNPEVIISNGDKWTGNNMTIAHNMNAYSAILPVQQSGYSPTNSGINTMTCLTCHQAHGTSATVTDSQIQATPAHSATLLRLDNQGVCEACHMK